MIKPQDEYLKILYRINDTYIRYDIDKYDILDEINELESKKNYSAEDLILLENKCLDEWYKLISKICVKTISFIESKKVFEERLLKEKKKIRKIQAHLGMSMTLPKYDEIYETICELLDDIKITEKLIKRHNKERSFDILIGFLLGFFGSILIYFIF